MTASLAVGGLATAILLLRAGSHQEAVAASGAAAAAISAAVVAARKRDVVTTDLEEKQRLAAERVVKLRKLHETAQERREEIRREIGSMTPEEKAEAGKSLLKDTDT